MKTTGKSPLQQEDVISSISATIKKKRCTLSEVRVKAILKKMGLSSFQEFVDGDNVFVEKIAAAIIEYLHERHYSLSEEEKANKAFILCRNALAKGKMPKGVKEKDIKNLCFRKDFQEIIKKCECKIGFNDDKLIEIVGKKIIADKEKKLKQTKKIEKSATTRKKGYGKTSQITRKEWGSAYKPARIK